MRDRVARDPSYKGVTICARWDDFSLFLADNGERPPGLTLDRIDNKLGYQPGNCRWATQAQQQNNRSDNLNITHLGETKTLAQWAVAVGLNYRTLYSRICLYGWDPARALTSPHRGWNKSGRFG